MDRRSCSWRSATTGVELRAYKAGAKPDDEDDGEEVDDTDPNRGLIDIDGRIDVVIDRRRSGRRCWEAWRRLRDEWWHPGMRFEDDSGGCDWPGTLEVRQGSSEGQHAARAGHDAGHGGGAQVVARQRVHGARASTGAGARTRRGTSGLISRGTRPCAATS